MQNPTCRHDHPRTLHTGGQAKQENGKARHAATQHAEHQHSATEEKGAHMANRGHAYVTSRQPKLGHSSGSRAAPIVQVNTARNFWTVFGVSGSDKIDVCIWCVRGQLELCLHTMYTPCAHRVCTIYTPLQPCNLSHHTVNAPPTPH